MLALLVEDNPSDAELVRLAVEEMAPHVELAVVNSGEDALAYLHRSGDDGRAKLPDLVLLDLEGPADDGLRVLREIRRDPLLRGLPVVVMTSADTPAGLERAKELQAAACFSKPATGHGELVAQVIAVAEAAARGAAQAEQERAAELARSNAELEQFAYVASHDLQEPLRTVASYTDLLARRYGDQLDERAAKYIGYAQEGAARMRRLIEDLLAYSRVRSRGRDPERVEASRCLTRSVENLQLRLRESNATLDRDELPVVLADETQLTEVFQNLLSNALKFRAGEPPRVRIRAEPRGSHVCFYVEDNGIGLSEEHADRIFDVFERLHTRDEYPGTGIGLALCKRVVERHGGRIGVHPNDAGGSTFWFTLPAAASGQSSGEPSPE